MSFFLVLTLYLCFSSLFAVQPSTFLSENQNVSNISVIDIKVNHSNITGLSNFLVSCSSVPSQVLIVTSSGYDFGEDIPMLPYFNFSRVLKELGENSLYIDYRYYRVYAKALNSGSNLNISLDLPTKHNIFENLTAIAWCMDNTSQSSGYSIGSYGPFNNRGVPITIKVTYSQPLRTEEVKLQTNLLASYLNLSFYSTYDHFGTRLYPNSNEEKVFYVPYFNEYNTYLDNDFFAVQDNNYERLSDALNSTNINQTLAGFNTKLKQQNFLPVATAMSVTATRTIIPNFEIRNIESTSNSVSFQGRTLGQGKFSSFFTTKTDPIINNISWLSFWNGEDMYGNPLPNLRQAECNYSDYQIFNYGGLNSNTAYAFQYFMNQPGPFQLIEVVLGGSTIETKSNQAIMLGSQIIALLLLIHCLIN